MDSAEIYFVLLSYKRPGNMSRILTAIEQSNVPARVVVVNNNPDVNLLDYLEPSASWLLVQGEERWPAVNRFGISRSIDAEYFASIDDDVFLSPQQIEFLYDKLMQYPEHLHGVWGEEIVHTDPVAISSGLHGFDRKLSILNKVYFYTKRHVESMFELIGSLRIEYGPSFPPVDDILLSLCTDGDVLCYDVGELVECPSCNCEEVALWLQADFHSIREEYVRKILNLRTCLR